MSMPPPPVLENLAHYIVHSESTKALKDRLSDILLRKYQVGTDIIDPVDGVLRFLSEKNDLVEAVKYLVESRGTLISLANEVQRAMNYEFCDLDASHEQAVAKVLEASKVPVIRWQPEYEGAVRIDRRLEELEQQLSELRECNNPETLKYYGNVTWDYLGTLLKISINFYSEFFGYGDVSPVSQCFAHARRQSSLNPLLDAIQAIEKSFSRKDVIRDQQIQNGDTDGREIEKDGCPDESGICLWYFGRRGPFQGFLDDETEILRCEVPSSWIEIAAEIDQGLRNREGDQVIKILRLNKYKADVKYFRNFYGHSDEKGIVIAGISKARASFQAGRHLIKRLIGQHLCPVLIVPTEIGFDPYGRRVVRFVHERDIKDNGTYSKENVKYLFARKDEQVGLHVFCFCASPAVNGMFEPVIYPVQRILPT